jgi:hypothetical protein
LRENAVLKRGVAIQHERQKEFDDKTQEVHHLKQLVLQHQGQVKTLEVYSPDLTSVTVTYFTLKVPIDLLGTCEIVDQ